jgi:hypothetical protein
MSKSDDGTDIYIVETVSMFRMRYAIRAKSKTHAEDEFVMEVEKELNEMSQKHLDEIIVSTRKVSEKKYLEIFDEDNDYLQSWDNETKLKSINVIDYSKDYHP